MTLRGERDDVALYGSTRGQLGGINAVRSAQGAGDIELARVDVHCEDSRGLAGLGALDDGQAHGAQAEHRHCGTLLDVAGLPGSAQTRAVLVSNGHIRK